MLLLFRCLESVAKAEIADATLPRFPRGGVLRTQEIITFRPEIWSGTDILVINGAGPPADLNRVNEDLRIQRTLYHVSTHRISVRNDSALHLPILIAMIEWAALSSQVGIESSPSVPWLE